jgi:hypothetical protein
MVADPMSVAAFWTWMETVASKVLLSNADLMAFSSRIFSITLGRHATLPWGGSGRCGPLPSCGDGVFQSALPGATS